MLPACSACVLWEKFSRATSRPARIRYSIMRGERLAGPIVATIFVRRNVIFFEDSANYFVTANSETMR